MDKIKSKDTQITVNKMEAENKKLIALNNNFGNRFIEFLDIDYNQLLEDYFTDGEM